MDVRERAHHVLNRIAHGPTPAQIAQLNSHQQVVAHILAQLNVDDGYDTATAARRAEFGVEPGANANIAHGWDLDDLQREHLLLGIQSDRQLREVMARFWMTHFSTAFQKVRQPFQDTSATTGYEKGIWAEYTEYKAYRRLAFASFAQLLSASFNSAAMRSYLNVFNSRKDAPNEDYPREFLELHTIGEINETTGDPNYDQQDIVETSRVFTGYRVDWITGAATSDSNQHDIDAKSIFVNVTTPRLDIPAAGAAQSTATDPVILIRHIVQTDACKDFICRKLIRWFIGDKNVSQGLLDTCKSPAVWGLTGNIRLVLETILTSGEFHSASRIAGRLEQPFETLCSMIRQFGGTIASVGDLEEMHRRQRLMEQRFYEFPSPDGYPLASLEQPGSSVFMHVGRIARQLRESTLMTADAEPMPNLAAMYGPYAGLSIADRANAATVASTYVDFLYPGRYALADELVAQSYLVQDAAGNLSAWDSTDAGEVRERIARMCVYLASMPQAFQK